MQAVDRGLGAAHALGDLARGEADQVAQDDDAALILGQATQRVLEAPAPIDAHVVGRLGVVEDLLGRHGRRWRR